MFTVTKDLILPSTTTGSFPRPRWFDVSMWGRPLDTCMMDVHFREKFQVEIAAEFSDAYHSLVDDGLVHGIARGSGDRRHDSAIDSCEFIEQRGLADIRVPDDSHPDFMRLLRS